VNIVNRPASGLPRSSARMLRLGVCLVALLLPVSGFPWTRVTEIPITDVYSVSRHGSVLYAGTLNTVHIGENNGTTWSTTAVVHSEAAGIEAVIPAGDALWAGTFGHGVFHSTDGGMSWTPVNSGLSGLGAFYISEFVERSGKLYAATYGAGVFVLDLADPTSWTPSRDGFPVDISGNVYALTRSGSNIVAGAGANGYVYLLPENSTSWQEVSLAPNAAGLQVTDLVDNGAFLIAGTTSQNYRSSNSGASWTSASGGFPNPLETLVASNGALFYAAAVFLDGSYKVYQSTDAGDTWQLLDPGSPFYPYGMETAGGRLFAARLDGLWWIPIPVTSVEEADARPPTLFRMSQNTPNPVRTHTSVSFVLPTPGDVSLRLIDVSGRSVATPVEERPLAAGEHRLTFAVPEGLPSGVYFYELRYHGETLRRRLALVR
jgi:hypothetical protein